MQWLAIYIIRRLFGFYYIRSLQVIYNDLESEVSISKVTELKLEFYVKEVFWNDVRCYFSSNYTILIFSIVSDLSLRKLSRNNTKVLFLTLDISRSFFSYPSKFGIA